MGIGYLALRDGTRRFQTSCLLNRLLNRPFGLPDECKKASLSFLSPPSSSFLLLLFLVSFLIFVLHLARIAPSQEHLPSTFSFCLFMHTT